MDNIVSSIFRIRDSVCAILKITAVDNAGGDKTAKKFQLNIVGSAWCVVPNKVFITAHHTLNNGNPRNQHDKFYIFAVPQNGPVAYHYKVVNFILEDQINDMAIFEIDSHDVANVNIPSVSITFQRVPDGERVLTCGFPSPTISDARLDEKGNWLGGTIFLKSHANEGIVAAQYQVGNQLTYEFNVNWYNGESGGPIFLLNPLAAFSLMQQFRNIQTQIGVVPGPHIGKSIVLIHETLSKIGAAII